MHGGQNVRVLPGRTRHGCMQQRSRIPPPVLSTYWSSELSKRPVPPCGVVLLMAAGSHPVRWNKARSMREVLSTAPTWFKVSLVRQGLRCSRAVIAPRFAPLQLLDVVIMMYASPVLRCLRVCGLNCVNRCSNFFVVTRKGELISINPKHQLLGSQAI